MYVCVHFLPQEIYNDATNTNKQFPGKPTQDKEGQSQDHIHWATPPNINRQKM